MEMLSFNGNNANRRYFDTKCSTSCLYFNLDVDDKIINHYQENYPQRLRTKYRCLSWDMTALLSITGSPSAYMSGLWTSFVLWKIWLKKLAYESQGIFTSVWKNHNYAKLIIKPWNLELGTSGQKKQYGKSCRLCLWSCQARRDFLRIVPETWSSGYISVQSVDEI